MGSFQFIFFLSLLVINFQFALSTTNITSAPQFRCNGREPKAGLYVNGSIFQSNLNLLLSSFSSHVHYDNGVSNGFWNNTIGQHPDQVFGYYFCRGDVLPETCKNCVQNATQEVKKVCGYEKMKIIWFDECMLSYRSSPSFTKMEHRPHIYLLGKNDITIDANKISSMVGEKFASLLANASFNPSRISTEQVNLPKSSDLLLAVAQCTPDLPTNDCKTCLMDVSNEFPSKCCGGKQTATIFTHNCFLHYEIRPVSVHPPPPPSMVKNTTSNMATTKKNRKKTSNIVMFVFIPLVILFILSAILVQYLRSRKTKHQRIDETDEIMEALRFSYRTICAATNNFCDANKLGQGGFGAVYKGKLLGGEQIAAKRLSGQGVKEFKNEVEILAKLQHKNLVKLLGYSYDGVEKLLIFEYVPNGSLDRFIFGSKEGANFDWDTRYKIIAGIARGLLYIHEDSRLKIIHRDLKGSNILLDAEMNPKIADFGIAKLLVTDRSLDGTSKIVGTHGYMAPEYAMHGEFSAKSDVYSFGVLLLEIITGQRINYFYDSEHAVYLLTFVWKHWEEKTPLEVIDQRLRDCFSETEAIRCIQIGLLCVQEITERPTIASVVLMLTIDIPTLPLPAPPAYLDRNRIHPTENQSSREVELDQPTITSNSSIPEDEISITEMHPW